MERGCFAHRVFVTGLDGAVGVDVDVRFSSPLLAYPEAMDVVVLRALKEAVVRIMEHARRSGGYSRPADQPGPGDET